MDSYSNPSIVNCDTSSTKNARIYDAWAQNYAQDIRDWGYTLPEVVAQELHQCVKAELHKNSKIRVLDAGAGDGLSGVALREAGFDESSAYISGNDISSAMLDIAKERKCYDDVKLVDLNKAPLPYKTDEFDVVTCTGEK